MIWNVLFNLELIMISFVTWFFFILLSFDILFDIINILSHIVSLVCSHWNREKYLKYIVNWIKCWMLDQNVYTQLVNSFCDEQRALCSKIIRRTSIKIVPCLVYRKNTNWIFNIFFLFFPFFSSALKHRTWYILDFWRVFCSRRTTYYFNVSLSGFFS